MASLDSDVKDIKNAVTGSGTSSGAVQGAAASGAAASGAPVLVGGRYDSTTPAVLDDGDVGEFFIDSAGRLHVINDGALNPTDDAASIMERQASIAPTVTVDTAAYVDGDVVGGIITLASASGFSGKGVVLEKVVLRESGGQAPALYLMFFSATPSGGTYTDNAALAYGTNDEANFVGGVSIVTADWVITSSRAQVTVGDLNIPMACGAVNMFMLIIAKGAYDAVAATDLKPTATFKQRY